MINCDLTVSEVFQAYYDCRKTKRNTWNALQFEENLERNLMDLYYELVNMTYKPGRSIMFVVTRPKPREVWAADFKDRVVHHILYNRYADHFYKKFIFDSYACIPEKGTLKAANRVQYFIRAATNNHTRSAMYLKADVANFFVSINKSILDTLLSKEIKDTWWQWLMKAILHKDPRDNVYIKSNKKLLNKVPKHKSLLNSPIGFGLPIGNLSSQFFANIYLNELDQYVKQGLKIKYYARYVDDIIIVSGENINLNDIFNKIQTYLNKNLDIKLHLNKKEINKVNLGINFVGYVIKPFQKYIRRSTLKNMYKNTKNVNNFIKLRSIINSYFGMLKHVNAYKERKRAVMHFSKRGCWFNGTLTKLVRLGNI